MPECRSCGISARSLTVGGVSCICAVNYGRASKDEPCEMCKYGFFKPSIGDSECLPATKLEVPSALAAVLIALQGISVLGSMTLFLIMIVFRKAKVVNASYVF